MELNHNNFVLIILIGIIFTQIYQIYEEPLQKLMLKNSCKKEKVIKNVKINDKIITEKNKNKVEEKPKSILKNKNEVIYKKESIDEANQNEENNLQKVDISMYGTPDNVFENDGDRIFEWAFTKPNPWSKIYYNTNNETISFGLKHKIIPGIIEEWERILPNIGYSNDLILVTSKDEPTALGIVNLILSTLNNEMTIKDILDNNLINISIGKIKAHPLVRTKILEQIMSKIQIKEHFNQDLKSEVTADLADKNSKSFGFDAYGGNEYQFIN